MDRKPEPVNPYREPIRIGDLMRELLLELENPERSDAA